MGVARIRFPAFFGTAQVPEDAMQIRRTARLAIALFAAVGSLFGLAVQASAADQLILGKLLLVKDPKPGVDPSKRGIIVFGKEAASPSSIVGDPLANGATVEIIANGTLPSTQTFPMPAGAQGPGGVPGWKALGNPIIGYSYKDSTGVNGPVKVALIKKTPSGIFMVKVLLNGALGAINVTPPAPGTDGGMRFAITGGDTYCVTFGGTAGGKVTNAPGSGIPNKVFKIASTGTSPTSETACPVFVPPVMGGVELKGALPPTVGRFNYNLVLGLPGANAACNSFFAGTHACEVSELQAAESAGDLVGLTDTNSTPVTSFWAIDSTRPALLQCQDDVGGGSFLNWEYGTAHTASRGEKLPLNNGTGTLGALQTPLQCNLTGSSWVGCCI